EVVQLYVKALDNTSASNPIKRLVGFQKVTLNAGQSQTVSISVNIKDIALWDDATNKYDVKAGRYQFDLATTADDADVIASKTVSVSGSWNETIQTATLESDTLVVGANENTKLSLTVSLDNDRMLNSGYTATYTSSNPDVVKVSNDGTVTCSETAGVATVIATISYNGETVTASTPIVSDYSAALVRLTPKEVTLDGEAFTIFDVSQNRYDVFVIGEKAPKLRVVAAAGTTASVTQNGFALPSTATIVLTDELTAHQETYTVHFYSESVMLKPDDFTSQSLNTDLWKGQTIGSSSCEYIPGTGLRLHTTEGENSNMVLQRADGSFFVESKVHFSSLPSQGYQQGGFEVYQDASNYVKFTLEPHVESLNFKLQKTVGGTAYEISSSIKTRNEVSNTVYFRLQKEGTMYRAYYSLDGTNYIFAGAGSADFKNTSLALVGFHALSAPSVGVTFNYVKLVEEQYVFESNGDSGIDYPTAPTVYLDGQRFYPFNAAQFDYDIAVKGVKAPTVTVEAADGTTAQVVQTNNDFPAQRPFKWLNRV
ncbi:MAG: fibronectin type III-like domain-contianing protein, partial [Clostridia bacterium]|nr:fibronectin type III-like domain-contianing protein [Clostridia bacterium]